MAATTDEMIQDMERYVLERYLGIAQVLADEFRNANSTSPLKQSGYAILSVVMSYFEMIESWSKGCCSPNGKSRDYFTDGFKKMYSGLGLSDAEIHEVYDMARCGMYHRGMTKPETPLSRNYSTAFAKVGNEWRINPWRLVEDIKAHFSGVVNTLREPSNLNERDQLREILHIVEMG